VLAHLIDLHARNLITTANVITPHSHFQTI
jgi:hypothetical protein